MSYFTYVLFGSCSSASFAHSHVTSKAFRQFLCLSILCMFMPSVNAQMFTAFRIDLLDLRNHCDGKTASVSKESKSKAGVAQHGLSGKADSTTNNDRKDGRERRDDMQPKVTGRPQHITHSMRYEPLLASLQRSQLKQCLTTLNRPKLKRRKEKYAPTPSLIRNTIQAWSLDELLEHIIVQIPSILTLTRSCEDNLLNSTPVISCTPAANSLNRKNNMRNIFTSRWHTSQRWTQHNPLLNLTYSGPNSSPINLQIPNMVTDKAADAINDNNVSPWQYTSLFEDINKQ